MLFRSLKGYCESQGFSWWVGDLSTQNSPVAEGPAGARQDLAGVSHTPLRGRVPGPEKLRTANLSHVPPGRGSTCAAQAKPAQDLHGRDNAWS